MKLSIIGLVFAASATAALAQAPAGAPAAPYRGPARDIEALYKSSLQQIQRAAEAMSAEDFHFKPHSDSPSFAELVRTVIDGEHAACDDVNETPAAQRSAVPSESASKDEMIAALKLASAACDKSYAALTMENASDLKVSGNSKRGQISILAWNYAHNAQQYGTMLAYLQDKGVKPATPPRQNAAANGASGR